jgi:DNA-binding transcriptional LysR family regulator
MELKQLKAFVLVSRKGKLSHAAKSLGLTPAGISLRLKRLERELGITLFERKPNKLLLTASGKSFADYVERTLEDLDGAVTSARGDQERAQKTIAIALGGDTAFLLGSAFGDFARSQPRVKLSMLTRSSSETLELVLDDRVDLGIGRFSNIPRSLEAVDLLLPHSLVAIYPKKSIRLGPKRLTIDQLASHPMIALPQHSATRRAVDEVFARHGLEMNMSIEAGGCIAIKQFVRLHLGVGLVHDICIFKEEQSEFTIWDLNHLFGQWKTTLIYKKSRPLSAPHRELIDTLSRAIARWKTKKRTFARRSA